MMEFASDRTIDSAMQKAGIQQLKKEQRTAIHEFKSGRDVIAGYGKSFCYALLPAVFDELRVNVGSSIVICVSP